MRYVIVLLVVVLWGCSGDKEEKCVFIPDTKDIQIKIEVEQFEDFLPSITNKDQLVSFFAQHTVLRDVVFGREAYPDDSVFINELYARFTNPHIDTLLQETKRVYGDLSQLKNEFTAAFATMKYYYPDFQPPKIQTVITGLETDLVVSDTLIVIGLDYYLGNGARYRPNMYDYMLRRYEPNFIVPSVMLLYGIDERINKTDVTDRTVLAEMISYGKAYYFAKHMLPCVPDSVLIGYSAKEISGAHANEDIVWKKLVEDEVFFATSPLMKQKYISERPKTIDIDEEAPGRIGTWLGWQIVKAYAKRLNAKKANGYSNEASLPELMRTKDAKLIFNESRYRPVEP